MISDRDRRGCKMRTKLAKLGCISFLLLCVFVDLAQASDCNDNRIDDLKETKVNYFAQELMLPDGADFIRIDNYTFSDFNLDGKSDLLVSGRWLNPNANPQKRFNLYIDRIKAF